MKGKKQKIGVRALRAREDEAMRAFTRGMQTALRRGPPSVVARPVANEAASSRLPDEASARKSLPIFSGVLAYFPDAIAAVAEASKQGNDQHNPGEPLHWDRPKSTDHADCIARHLIDHGLTDSDGIRHSAKLAWRALALLQIEIESDRNLGPSRGSRT